MGWRHRSTPCIQWHGALFVANFSCPKPKLHAVYRLAWFVRMWQVTGAEAIVMEFIRVRSDRSGRRYLERVGRPPPSASSRHHEPWRVVAQVVLVHRPHSGSPKVCGQPCGGRVSDDTSRLWPAPPERLWAGRPSAERKLYFGAWNARTRPIKVDPLHFVAPVHPTRSHDV